MDEKVSLSVCYRENGFQVPITGARAVSQMSGPLGGMSGCEVGVGMGGEGVTGHD